MSALLKGNDMYKYEDISLDCSKSIANQIKIPKDACKKEMCGTIIEAGTPLV